MAEKSPPTAIEQIERALRQSNNRRNGYLGMTQEEICEALDKVCVLVVAYQGEKEFLESLKDPTPPDPPNPIR